MLKGMPSTQIRNLSSQLSQRRVFKKVEKATEIMNKNHKVYTRLIAIERLYEERKKLRKELPMHRHSQQLQRPQSFSSKLNMAMHPQVKAA